MDWTFQWANAKFAKWAEQNIAGNGTFVIAFLWYIQLQLCEINICGTKFPN